MVVPILAALQLAVPVLCYQDTAAFEQRSAEIGFSYPIRAYYTPAVEIALSPQTCRDVLEPNLEGAEVLAHELAHHWQWWNGRPLLEAEADRIALWARGGLLRVLERLLGRRAVPAVSLP